MNNLESTTDCIVEIGENKPSNILHYTNSVKTASKILSCLASIDSKNEDYNKIERFISTSDKFWAKLKRKSENAIHLARQTVNRKPENLPRPDDVKKLLDCLVLKLDEISLQESPNFHIVRRYLSSYLTLCNARRGEEVHRLTITDCSEGLSRTWENPMLIKQLSSFTANK